MRTITYTQMFQDFLAIMANEDIDISIREEVAREYLNLMFLIRKEYSENPASLNDIMLRELKEL